MVYFGIDNGVLRSITVDAGENDIVIPSEVETIEIDKCDAADYGFAIHAYHEIPTGIQSLVVPASVKCINSLNLEYMFNLKTVIFDCSVTNYKYDVYSFSGCLFRGSNKLEKVVLPEGITKIDYYTFEGCTNLKEIHIPDSVTAIEDDAFKGCAHLKELYAKNVEKVGNILGNRQKKERIIPLIFPKITPSKAGSDSKKICVALGYLLHPECFSGASAKAWEKYCSENAEIIKEKATANKINVGDKLVTNDSEESSLAIAQASVSDAKEVFFFTNKKSGVRIDKYRGQEKIISVPFVIGRTEVTSTTDDAFPDGSVVICNAKLFKKLPLKIQKSTYSAYMSGTIEFPASQRKAMDEVAKKKDLT